jgi:3-oxoacyl-[acyl-carrier-protein] synthase II
MKSSVLRQLLAANPLVVTGCGAFSAAGDSLAALWDHAVRGRVPAQLREFSIGGRQRSIAVCSAPEIDSQRPELHPVRRADRVVQLAWLGALQALQAAGVTPGGEEPRIGVVAGTARGPLSRLAVGFERVGAGSHRYPPSLAADCALASLSGALAQGLKFTGPGGTLAATCASGAFAIAYAAEQLLLGKADIMLVGGSEAPLVPAVLAQLEAAGMLGSHPDPAQTCRPFDHTRNGLCLGEGSAFLVLETSASANRRGARPLARLAGWGQAVDLAGRVGVSAGADGLVRAASHALALAGLEPGMIDHVNAHGTGTVMNDFAEARALRDIFGDRAAQVPCSSTKPVTGHCLGATPALEAMLAVEALREQFIPPTANCRLPDPECGLDVVPLAARPARLNHVMSNSLGFWGYHASLIFSRV